MKQPLSSSIYNKYPEGSDFGGRKTLNLGCGFATFRAKNVINLDAYGSPDVKWDLNKTPLPFEDNYFDFIVANHILEHLQTDKWWAIFEECARILKPNGTLEIWVPGAGSDAIFGFRDHCVQITAESFYGTFGTYRAGTNAWAHETMLSPANRMKGVGATARLHPYWWLKGPRRWKQWCSNHLRNVVFEQGFLFRKVTDAELTAEMEKCADRFRK